jgi:hypothetical protein
MKCASASRLLFGWSPHEIASSCRPADISTAGRPTSADPQLGCSRAVKLTQRHRDVTVNVVRLVVVEDTMRKTSDEGVTESGGES